jgi:hypothetical protein
MYYLFTDMAHESSVPPHMGYITQDVEANEL